MATAESVKAKLQALLDSANAATGNGDADLTAAVASLIAGFGQGGGSEAVELVYESEFTINETNLTSTAVAVATFETGLNLVSGDSCWCVIECTNDTDEDTSYNHIRARTQNLALIPGSYTSVYASSGHIYSEVYDQYGSSMGLWVSGFGKCGATITVSTKYSGDNFGAAPSGDYSLKLYKFNNDFFGLEGVSDR